MFLDQNARGEGVGRVLVVDRHDGLEHDRASIELRGNDVHGGTTDLDAVVPRLGLPVEPGEGRQERWMDVEDAVRERLDERCAQQPHETSEAHERDVAFLELVYHREIQTAHATRNLRD